MMRHETVEALVSPQTGSEFKVEHIEVEADGEIKEGYLVDSLESEVIPIRNFIPRFIESETYTANFGLQWNRLRRTQIDRFNGTSFSADRFYRGTGWTPEELRGQRILEVGCGAGRFTQVMLDAGAEIYTLDYSTAVDACWANNGPHPTLSIVQADLYAIPFKKDYFDKVFCYGVLQHTPDVKAAFMSLVPFLKPEGKLSIDVYARPQRPSRWTSKYLWRPLTKRISPQFLFRIIEWYIPRWLPIDNQFQRIPKLGTLISAIIPCWNYTNIFPLTPDQIKEWAILDTFDALSARYDWPQTISQVQSWFEEADLYQIDVRYGINGIVGNARKAPV